MRKLVAHSGVNKRNRFLRRMKEEVFPNLQMEL